MEIQNQQMGETAVVEIAGKVTIGYDAQMRDAIEEASGAGAQNILLNMRNVSKLDSSGVGELVAAHNRMKDRGGRLLLVALPARLATVLQITNLMGVLEIYTDIDTALATLNTGKE